MTPADKTPSLGEQILAACDLGAAMERASERAAEAFAAVDPERAAECAAGTCRCAFHVYVERPTVSVTVMPPRQRAVES
jgi:hypothetical protein